MQATVTLLGLTSSAATEAALCALVVVWWAFSTRRARPAPAKELKPDPFNDDAPAPFPGTQGHAESGPPDLDRGTDTEAFQAQVGRRCDLELEALCDKVLQDVEDELGGTLRRELDFDFETFQAHVVRRCDLELDALCDKVLQDLEDELGGSPAGAEARRLPTNEEPVPDLEAKVELHCDAALEGMCGNAKDANDGALDGMCVAVLKALEDECAEFGALDDSMKADRA